MAEAETLVSDDQGGGSQHRAIVMFCDLVGSTELSGKYDPERYGLLVRRYMDEVRRSIEERFDGDVISEAGDGLLVLFGALHAHGDDAERAIRAALEVIDRVRALSCETESNIGESLAVRIGIHRGPIYRTNDGSVYGLAVNIAARLQTLAAPNMVVVSDDIQRMVGHLFDLEAEEPQLIKGVDQPFNAHRVVGERVDRPGRSVSPVHVIGREAEWHRLQSAWNAVRDRSAEHASAVLVRGEAGIGKSQLVARISEVAARDGASVVEVGGSAIEDSGLYPVRRLIERSLGVRKGAGGPERLQRLSEDLSHRGFAPDEFVPRLAPILGLEPAAGYVAEPVDARKLNEEVLEAASAYVGSLLGDAPSLLVFEDVQWYDSSTHLLMERLTKRKEPTLIVMTARPGTVAADETELIDLEPLSHRDSGLLVDRLCEYEPISEEIRRDVVARSDGIPLYIEELVANVQRGLPSGPEETSGHSAGSVPDLLYDLLAARLATAADVIPVATASAVVGRDVDRQLLQALLDLSPEVLDASLATLRDKGVLEGTAAGEGQYRFRHELLREVAYELQPPSRRRYVHERVAHELVSREARGGVADWGVIASHFEQAEQWVPASDAYGRAADAARGIGAFAQARQYVTRAIAVLTLSTPGHDRDVHEVRLRLQRGFLAVSEEGHASPAAASDYDRCLELAADDPFGDEMFETVIVLWTYHLVRGEIQQARQISESTYRNIEKREWYRSFNLAAFGILECFEGDFGAARDRLEAFATSRVPENEQQFVAQWFNPNEAVTGILTTVGLVRFMTGDVVGAEKVFADAFQRAESMEFPQGPYSFAYALSFEAWMRLELEQFDKAEERIDLLAEIAARHGFDEWAMVAVTQRPVLAGLRARHGEVGGNEFADQASSLEAMTDIWKQFDTRGFLPYYLTAAGILYGCAGNRAAAHRCLMDSLNLGGEDGPNFWRAETLRHLALLEADPPSRTEKLRDALRLARLQRASLFELRIALDLVDQVGVEGSTDIRQALGQLGPGASYPEVARAGELLATLE